MLEIDLKKSREFKNLCKVLTKFNDEKNVAAFLRDVCTYKELEDMSERLEAAVRINKGIPYRNINQQTGTSTATISRVAKWLSHGCGGYQKALQFLK